MATDGAREHILHTAGEVFAEKGFDASTVREICAAAEANVAAVNYYFGDKQQLYIEAVTLAQQTTSAKTPMPDWSADIPAEQRLEEFIRTLLTRMIGAEQAPWYVRLMTREVLNPTAACEQLVEVHFRPHFQLLIDILEGLFPKTTTLLTIRNTAFSIIGQCLFYRVAGDISRMVVPAKEFDAAVNVEQLTQHITAFSLAAITNYDPQHKSRSTSTATELQ